MKFNKKEYYKLRRYLSQLPEEDFKAVTGVLSIQDDFIPSSVETLWKAVNDELNYQIDQGF